MNLGVLERWHFSFKKPLLSLPFRRVTWKGTHITFASLIKESQCHTRTTKKVGGGGKLQNFSNFLYFSRVVVHYKGLASEVFRGRFNTPFNLTYRLEMIHFTGDIYGNHVPQHLLPFELSIIFHFSRQKLVLK